jgi:hypothetical protein
MLRLGTTPKRALAGLVTAFASGCLAPHVPNSDLVQACRTEPANWHRQTVTANVVLTADFVYVLGHQPRWSDTAAPGQPGYDACGRCVALLRQGLASVEYLPPRSPTLDTVWRYTFANAGDPRCWIDHAWWGDDQPPEGKCLAVERDVPRTARYAVALFDVTSELHGTRISRWIYEADDLTSQTVLAHAVNVHQTGWESPMYECKDVNVDRGDGAAFVERAIRPASSPT